MRFLPLFLDLSTATVALIGNSAAATAKLRLLRSAGATVRWYSADIDVSVELLAACLPPAASRSICPIRWRRTSRALPRWCRPMATRATRRSRNARAPATRWSMSSTVPDLSNFIVPAIVDRGDVVVAIGTGGASPVLARRLRERIEAMLPARHRRTRRADGPLPRRLRARASSLAFAAAFLGAGDRRADRRGSSRRPQARGAKPDLRARSSARGCRTSPPARCIWSAPARAIPTC